MGNSLSPSDKVLLPPLHRPPQAAGLVKNRKQWETRAFSSATKFKPKNNESGCIGMLFFQSPKVTFSRNKTKTFLSLLKDVMSSEITYMEVL